jgi:hypothetical protein
VIQHHPYRSGTDFRGEFVRRLAHKGSILFGSWSLRQTRSGSILLDKVSLRHLGDTHSSRSSLGKASSGDFGRSLVIAQKGKTHSERPLGESSGETC